MEQKTNLPEHIAIVMDGNGRWAESKGLHRFQGHKKGEEVFRNVCKMTAEKVLNISLYLHFQQKIGKDLKMRLMLL